MNKQEAALAKKVGEPVAGDETTTKTGKTEETVIDYHSVASIIPGKEKPPVAGKIVATMENSESSLTDPQAIKFSLDEPGVLPAPKNLLVANSAPSSHAQTASTWLR